MRELTALAATERRNREIVVDFYERAILHWDYAAGAHLLGETYIQHDPAVADGLAGLRDFIETFGRAHPEMQTEIKRVFVDGDTVLLHVHSRRFPADEGVQIVEIYRVEDGKIVEHWDVIQQIPAEIAHNNGIF